MDEQRETVREHLFRELEAAITSDESPLSDLSHRPPDVLGFLADRQIRRVEIERICRDLAENWPSVQVLECGVRENRYPFLAIRIAPFNAENVKRHGTLISQIRDTYPQVATDSFYCLGEDVPFAVNAATSLYKRAA